MEASKHPLRSRGIFGGAVALLAALGLLGEISMSDQAALVDQLVAGAAAIGAALSIIGRWRATARIALFKPAADVTPTQEAP